MRKFRGKAELDELSTNKFYFRFDRKFKMPKIFFLYNREVIYCLWEGGHIASIELAI